MAVTVTKAAPPFLGIAGGLDIRGPYGVSTTSVYASNDGDMFANKRVKIARLTLSGTYATGGFTLTASDYGLKEIHFLFVYASANSATVPLSAGTLLCLDQTSSKSAPTVRLYTDTATELANTTSVTNFVFQTLVVGV